MKEILIAIRSALQAGIAYIADSDIFIVEDVQAIRPAGGYPAIGIKDGAADYSIEAIDQQEVRLDVTLAVYVNPAENETGIIGATGVKGVLDVAADIMALLRHNTLGGLVDTAVPQSVSASDQLSDGNKIILMVQVAMQYTKFDQI